MKPSKVLQKLVAITALSMPLASTGCSDLTTSGIKTILPNVSLYDVNSDGVLDENETEKYIRIEIAQGHTGPLTEEELKKLGDIVLELNDAYERNLDWSTGLKDTRVNLLKAYDKYRSLIYPTGTESTKNQ